MTVRIILVPSNWNGMVGIAVAASAAELGSPPAMALATVAPSLVACASQMQHTVHS